MTPTRRTHPEPARVKHEPAWKKVACPMCKAQPGDSCRRTSMGGFSWVKTAPHQWRKDAASNESARIARDEAATCRKCGGLMLVGVAIEPTFGGMPDFPGGEFVTLSPVVGPGRLIHCSKCTACGWSTT